MARILEEVRQAAPAGEEVARLDALAQRAFLIARAAKKLAAKLAPKRQRVTDSEFRRRWVAGETPEEWTAPALVVLSVALLVPWLHILSRGTRDPATGCLEVGSKGYSTAAANCGPAHRLVVMLMTGSALEGRLACHHCDNKPCIEPTHLYAGTSATNQRDRYKRSKTKPTRSDLPRFESWEQWAGGGWRAQDVPLWPDAEGVSGDVDVVDLPLSALVAADAMPLLCVSPERLVLGNPDAWSEEDERSLMVLGCLDGEEPMAWTRFVRHWLDNTMVPVLQRRPA